MRATHLAEIQANQTPLDRAIFDATKNIVVWQDIPGSAIVDWDKTRAAKAEIEAQVRREFAAGELRERKDEYADHTSGGTAADQFVDRSWEC